MPFSDPYDVPISYCLKCNLLMDKVSNATDIRKPKSGDYALCMKCGYIHVFDETLHLRAASDEERDVFLKDPRVLPILAAISEVAAQRKR